MYYILRVDRQHSEFGKRKRGRGCMYPSTLKSGSFLFVLSLSLVCREPDANNKE